MLYKSSFKEISGYVLRNSGCEEDTKDNFHEGFAVLIKNLRDPDFRLDCSLPTYLFSICRNLWRKELRYRKRMTTTELSYEMTEEEDNNSPGKNELYYQLFEKGLGSLGRDCIMVIRMYLNRVKISRITEIMGFKNDECTMNRKYKCTKKLIEIIRKDKKYKKYKIALYGGY
ncbi:MAG: hypothetical protein KJ607_12735 [Bacteroidetes bacterium]|nr:hypothetical protein [Bacteroidota bacterium]